MYLTWEDRVKQKSYPSVLEFCREIDWLLLIFSIGATPICPPTTVNRYLTSSAKFIVPMAVGSPSAALK
jgi:hypothetical protein